MNRETLSAGRAVRLLIGIRFQGLLNSMTRSSKGKPGKTAGRIIVMGLLYLYVAAIFIVMFGGMFLGLTALNDMGIGWMYFAVYALIGLALMIVGSAALAKTQIFDAKDNDLLLSMPIPSSAIVTSRMLMLVIVNLAYLLLVMLPAGVVWGVMIGFSLAGAAAFILLSAGLLLLSVALGIFMGWVIALISRRARNKAVITMLFTLAFLAVYMVVYFGAQQYIEAFIANGEQIAQALRTVAPLYWFGAAVSDGNVVFLLLALLICIVPFALAFYIISRTFSKIVSGSKEAVRVKEKKTRLSVSSVGGALLKREFSRLFSSATYLTNSGVGLILAVIAVVFLVIESGRIQQVLAQSEIPMIIISGLMLAAIMFLIGMVMFTSASVSIEGKNLWILRSLPVSTREILMAKLKLHLWLTLPVAVLMWLAVNVFFFAGISFLISSLLVTVCYTVFTANFGLVENLKHPVLNWVDESAVVKRGASATITVFVNMGISIAMMIVMSVVSVDMLDLAVAILAVVMAALAVLTHRWIMTKGVRRFEEL